MGEFQVECAQASGQMEPVVPVDQVLSKKSGSMKQCMEEAFSALDLSTPVTEIADDQSLDFSAETLFDESGIETITQGINEWKDMLKGFYPIKVIRKRIKLGQFSIILDHAKKFNTGLIKPKDMVCIKYKLTRDKKNTDEDLDARKGKNSNLPRFLLSGLGFNIIYVFYYKKKPIFGYGVERRFQFVTNYATADAALTRPVGNFIFKLYDSNFSKYEYFYRAWAISREGLFNQPLFNKVRIEAEKCQKELDEMDKDDKMESAQLDELMIESGISSFESFESMNSYIFFESSEQELFLEDGAKIDDDIRPVIQILNKKGYKTKYSCSGHPSARLEKDVYKDGVLNGKLYSTARIVFDGVYNLPNAPTGWTKKNLNFGKKDERVAIYVKAPHFKMVKGIPEQQFKNWKAKYMRNLRSWVDSLPDANDLAKGDTIVGLESVMEELMIETI